MEHSLPQPLSRELKSQLDDQMGDLGDFSWSLSFPLCKMQSLPDNPYPAVEGMTSHESAALVSPSPREGCGTRIIVQEQEFSITVSTVLRALLETSPAREKICCPHLQMDKVRPKESQGLIQSHQVRTQQS